MAADIRHEILVIVPAGAGVGLLNAPGMKRDSTCFPAAILNGKEFDEAPLLKL